MTKIVFEIPSHIYRDLMYITSIAAISDYKDEIGFAISTNGEDLSKKYDFYGSNIIVQHKKLEITDPCVSMVELRSNANELATRYFNPEFRIMADHNFQFKENWELFILEAVSDMEKFKNITGRDCYMGMGGTLGSYGHGSKAFLGPQPIFPCGRGIIYTKGDVYHKMKKLPSSLEEQYMTSVLFMEGHVPLRKMCSPIFHKMNDTKKGIHDKLLIDKYNSQIVREIWNDPYWVLKPSFTNTVRLSDGRYYANCPKNSMKAMINLKIELSRINGIEEFMKYTPIQIEPTMKD